MPWMAISGNQLACTTPGITQLVAPALTGYIPSLRLPSQLLLHWLDTSRPWD